MTRLEYAEDPMGRPIQSSVRSSTGTYLTVGCVASGTCFAAESQIGDIQLTYDANYLSPTSIRKRVSDSGPWAVYEYDIDTSLGLLVRSRSPAHFPADQASSAAVPFVVEYERDQRGRLTHQHVSAYQLGMSGPVMLAWQDIDYYQTGDPRSVSQELAGAEAAYLDYFYDDRHMLTRVRGTVGGGQIPYDGEYTYSPGGRLLTARDLTPGLVPVTDDVLGHGEAVSYVYDSGDPQQLSRLLSTQGQTMAAYAYDAAGNMIGRTRLGAGEDIAARHELRYDGSQRLRMVESQDGEREVYYYLGSARVRAVRYDAAGAVSEARRYIGDTELRYDGAGNRLQSVAPERAALGLMADQNLYTFAANNPLSYADPTGLETEPRLQGVQTLGMNQCTFIAGVPTGCTSTPELIVVTGTVSGAADAVLRVLTTQSGRRRSRAIQDLHPIEMVLDIPQQGHSIGCCSRIRPCPLRRVQRRRWARLAWFSLCSQILAPLICTVDATGHEIHARCSGSFARRARTMCSRRAYARRPPHTSHAVPARR